MYKFDIIDGDRTTSFDCKDPVNHHIRIKFKDSAPIKLPLDFLLRDTLALRGGILYSSSLDHSCTIDRPEGFIETVSAIDSLVRENCQIVRAKDRQE